MVINSLKSILHSELDTTTESTTKIVSSVSLCTLCILYVTDELILTHLVLFLMYRKTNKNKRALIFPQSSFHHWPGPLAVLAMCCIDNYIMTGTKLNN